MTPEVRALTQIEAELHHINTALVTLTNVVSDLAGMIEEQRGIKAEEEEEE